MHRYLKCTLTIWLAMFHFEGVAKAQSAEETVAFITFGFEEGTPGPYKAPMKVVTSNPLTLKDDRGWSTFIVQKKSDCEYTTSLVIKNSGYHSEVIPRWDFTNAADVAWEANIFDGKVNVKLPGGKMTCTALVQGRYQDCPTVTTFQPSENVVRAKAALKYLRENYCKGSGRAF